MATQEQPRSGSYGTPGPEQLHGSSALQVSLFCVIGVSFIGYLVGVRTPHLAAPPGKPKREVHVSESGVVPTLWYRDIARGTLSPNAGIKSDLADLSQPTAAELSQRSNDATDRSAALAERATRRAYSGAPPVVPHPVDPLSVAACLHCHESGLRIGDRIASPIPHQHYVSCTQCHVEQRELKRDEVWWLDNSFSGQAEATEGTRAYIGAPPTIPHGIALRSRCLSCHGPGGRDGMRTSHPHRHSCLQCHALDAALAQRAGR